MAKDAQSAKERAIAAVKKSMPSAFEDETNYGALTTGSIAADMVTVVGGFPRARLTEVSGVEASGKTSLCLSCVARAQRAGLNVAYLDPEQALDDAYARRLGVDMKELIFLRPSTFEQTAEAVNEFITEDIVDAVFVDSVSAMLPASVFDGDIGGVESVALRSRHMSAWIPRLIQTARASKRKPAIVLINQIRSIIPANTWAAKFGPKTTTTGGMAVRFYSSLRLEMSVRRKGNITRKADDPFHPGKDTEIPVGSEHRVEAIKNKVGSAYQEAPLYVRYDDKTGFYGVDNVKSLLDLSRSKNLIEETGKGRFTLDGQSFHGEPDLHDFLLTSPDACVKLATVLGLDWKNYSPLMSGSEVK